MKYKEFKAIQTLKINQINQTLLQKKERTINKKKKRKNNNDYMMQLVGRYSKNIYSNYVVNKIK